MGSLIYSLSPLQNVSTTVAELLSREAQSLGLEHTLLGLKQVSRSSSVWGVPKQELEEARYRAGVVSGELF